MKPPHSLEMQVKGGLFGVLGQLAAQQAYIHLLRVAKCINRVLTIQAEKNLPAALSKVVC